jgi:hypothetical protein
LIDPPGIGLVAGVDLAAPRPHGFALDTVGLVRDWPNRVLMSAM